MVCPKCGKENQNGSFSCQWCGAALPQVVLPVSSPIAVAVSDMPHVEYVAPSQPISTAIPVIKTQKKKFKWHIVLVLIVIFVVFISVGLLFLNFSGVEQTVALPTIE
jgi:hypothetical protein